MAKLPFGTQPPFTLAVALVMRLAARCVIGVTRAATLEPVIFDIGLFLLAGNSSPCRLRAHESYVDPKYERWTAERTDLMLVTR